MIDEQRSIPVGLVSVEDYGEEGLGRALAELVPAVSPGLARGGVVLLKPNLVSASGHDGLACSQPELVAAVARLFIDRGCRVKIGDSPAFGGGLNVMEKCGISAALSGLPVEMIDFDRSRLVRLAHGTRVKVAAESLECDLLVSLPRIKTHVQMLVTLAVKNLFGTVVGWRKPWLHARLGDHGNRFSAMFVDLLDLFPQVLTIVDGIVAMEGRGPIRGTPRHLGFLAASMSPVALDGAILDLIGLERMKSPIWRECLRRGLAGCDPVGVSFPLATPEEVGITPLALPAMLEPEGFNPLRLAHGTFKRVMAKMTG